MKPKPLHSKHKVVKMCLRKAPFWRAATCRWKYNLEVRSWLIQALKATQPACGVDLIGMAKKTVAKHKVLGFAKKDLDARRASAMLP